MKISIIHSKLASAQQQMEIDQEILNHLDPNGLPILRHYDWEHDSITYGVFAKPANLLDLKGIQKHKIDLGRRVTGGGATFHFSDLAFSFFLPKNHPCFSENTLKNYAWVNKQVARALSKWLKEDELIYAEKANSQRPEDPLFFCMARPTQYDILYKDKKIAGAAQRKKANGLLHHGSIAIAKPDEDTLRDILVDKEKGMRTLLKNHHYFVENHLKREEVARWREKIRKELDMAFIQTC